MQSDEEDLSEEAFRIRHIGCEIQEKKRYNTVPAANPRRRGNRTDSIASSGQGADSATLETSQSDALLGGGERAATPSLPSSDLGNPLPLPPPSLEENHTGSLGSAIKLDQGFGPSRRRSGSGSSRGSLSRSRSASHSEERRSQSQIGQEKPEHLSVSPWERRAFPLTEEEYSAMLTTDKDNSQQKSVQTPFHPQRVLTQTTQNMGNDLVASTSAACQDGSPLASDTLSDVEDPDDPEWTVISDKSQPSKRQNLVLKLAKRQQWWKWTVQETIGVFLASFKFETSLKFL